jgi:hypothetical protein
VDKLAKINANHIASAKTKKMLVANTLSKQQTASSNEEHSDEEIVDPEEQTGITTAQRQANINF